MENSEKSKIWYRETKNFKWLCKFSTITDGQVLAVEINNENYVKRLPPTLNIRKFGTG